MLRVHSGLPDERGPRVSDSLKTPKRYLTGTVGLGGDRTAEARLRRVNRNGGEETLPATERVEGGSPEVRRLSREAHRRSGGCRGWGRTTRTAKGGLLVVAAAPAVAEIVFLIFRGSGGYSGEIPAKRGEIGEGDGARVIRGRRRSGWCEKWRLGRSRYIGSSRSSGARAATWWAWRHSELEG